MDPFGVVHARPRRDVEKLVRSLVAPVWSADSDFRDEALAAALTGLWEAHQKYDASRSADFWAYARKFVRGRVQDIMRSVDPLSRRARNIVRMMADSKGT